MKAQRAMCYLCLSAATRSKLRKCSRKTKQLCTLKITTYRRAEGCYTFTLEDLTSIIWTNCIIQLLIPCLTLVTRHTAIGADLTYRGWEWDIMGLLKRVLKIIYYTAFDKTTNCTAHFAFSEAKTLPINQKHSEVFTLL